MPHVLKIHAGGNVAETITAFAHACRIFGVCVLSASGPFAGAILSQSEKAPFVAKADKLKAEYQKKLKAYDAEEDTKKEVTYEESSDKSKSEVSDEDEGSEEDDD